MNWISLQNIGSRAFECGHCDNRVAAALGYGTHDGEGQILICPHCEKPTFFFHGFQLPGVAPGRDVNSLPLDVEALYAEARKSAAASSWTGSVLLSRKLLMNIAVNQGAKVGLGFLEYVDFLSKAGYVPPGGKGWVDHIRKKGNEATHEIALMTKADAEELLLFSEMLLKFIYEFPSKVLPVED